MYSITYNIVMQMARARRKRSRVISSVRIHAVVSPPRTRENLHKTIKKNKGKKKNSRGRKLGTFLINVSAAPYPYRFSRVCMAWGTVDGSGFHANSSIKIIDFITRSHETLRSFLRIMCSTVLHYDTRAEQRKRRSFH